MQGPWPHTFARRQFWFGRLSRRLAVPSYSGAIEQQLRDQSGRPPQTETTVLHPWQPACRHASLKHQQYPIRGECGEATSRVKPSDHGTHDRNGRHWSRDATAYLPALRGYLLISENNG